MSFYDFHPLIDQWFHSQFEQPTPPQVLGWPPISAGGHTLIAAPTGSGKTLTAFLSCIDKLLGESLERGLDNEVRVVYVSPLRALSNDMHRNLDLPLQEINALAQKENAGYSPIRTGLRTGDTTPSQRAALTRKPPHILVTTPESLYLLLTAQKSRETLRNVETVIVDEIHALVRDKRGSHLALSLERLAEVTNRPLQRIGLSATQKPIERTAEFLVGMGADDSSLQIDTTIHEDNQAELIDFVSGNQRCTIVNTGHQRDLDLAIETPTSELGAVCMHEQWAEANERIVELIKQHRSTLIFVNTRRLAERVTYQLTEILGEDQVSSHHGSLSTETRLKTERQLKNGQLKAVVATASLELGLDIGYIDLVIQIGSPRSIATFLQRIGRSGHSLGVTPKGRLFALTRDEVLECMALIRAVRNGRLDAIPIPVAPLDVLAQQIVAEVAAEEKGTDELFELFRRAAPYHKLKRKDFDCVVEYLSEGIAKTTGRSRVYLHYDHVGKKLRARKGARIVASSNAGAIPEIASFRVVAEPEHTVVGSLDEDFAIESMAGDVFLLGNTSWRIQYIRGGDVTVVDAQGAPPTIPFWFGEAPGRTIELSEEVSRLREDLEKKITHSQSAVSTNGDNSTNTVQWLVEETDCQQSVARQIVTYVTAQKAAIGLLPTQKRVVFERFFDESGGMQIVVHAPFGGEINRAWGLAMRKRFCRSYDFELQATADDEGFILSIGPQHSFPLESLFPMLTSQNVRGLLEQAVLAVPMFQLRWRWNVTRSLLVLRRQMGKKVPPALQRFRADDLMTACFPRLTGCQEEHTGDIPIPDHPLVQQTLEDCLHEAVDLEGLLKVLTDIERGEITLVARDTREPSPFCYELLNSNPYTFLDGGEIQERRARAVTTRRSLTVECVNDLGRLDPAAIEQVREEANPLIRSAEELHDALLSRILVPIGDASLFPVTSGDETETLLQNWYNELALQKRVTTVLLEGQRAAWVPTERLPAVQAVFPDVIPDPPVDIPGSVQTNWDSTEARVAIVRGLIEVCGPITACKLARRVHISESQANASLEALEGEGVVLRGRFTLPPVETTTGESNLESTTHESSNGDQASIEWCHRRLLARIHRLTLAGLRREIEPVDVDVLMRFLFQHHGLSAGHRRTGANGLFETIAMLQGIDIPAQCWERDLLPSRLEKFESSQLDELCLTGEIGWGRLNPTKRNPERSKPMASLTRVTPLSIFLREDTEWIVVERQESKDEIDLLSSPSRQVMELLNSHGAMFAADLMCETRMLPDQLNDALGELVTRGLVTADGFNGLRNLIAEKSKSPRRSNFRRAVIKRRRATSGSTGRWSVWRDPLHEHQNSEQAEEDSPPVNRVEQWAWQLLRRWGVVFRDLLIREPCAPRWFELLQIYRRLEARGEIRGGRFVRGVAGEQFAVGDTVRQLRKLRDEPTQSELVVLSAADPLNLVGILTEHARIPSTVGNRVAYHNGKPLAKLQTGEVEPIGDSVQTVPTHIADQLRGTREFAANRMAHPATDSPSSKQSTETEPSNGESKSAGSKKSKRKKHPRYPNGIPRPIV